MPNLKSVIDKLGISFANVPIATNDKDTAVTYL